MEELQQASNFWHTAQEMIIQYTPKLVLAIVLLVVGLKIIARLSTLAQAAMSRAGISDNLLPFFGSMVGISLKILLLVSIAGLVGIDVTSFLAVLAAAGFAVGLALQGSLSNFAAGIIILVFRPYKVGEWIEVDEKFGLVEEIQIFNTLIVTPGRKTLIIPNSQIVEHIVTNYSRKGVIRVELKITMPYEESFPKIKEILLDAISQTPHVLSSPAPEIGIESFDTHNVIIAVRPYVSPDHYWDVIFEAHARIKMAFFEHQIPIAYPDGVELGPIGA